jgi:uncharacterized membrane protein
MPRKVSTTKRIAFVAVMSALANILGYLSIPIGTTKIHFMQLPIVLTALAFGAIAGGVVGFIGATVMALTLPMPNFFLLPGNALLGFLTGFFYSKLRNMKPPIAPQLIALIAALVIQFPYVYVTDVYSVSMPSPVVLYTILPKLFVEDIISLLIAHVILFRVDIALGG